MKKKSTTVSTPVLAIRPQHSCFAYENDDVCVTVWSKRKKRMRLFEIGMHLDLAKAHLMERIRGY